MVSALAFVDDFLVEVRELRRWGGPRVLLANEPCSSVTSGDANERIRHRLGERVRGRRHIVGWHEPTGRLCRVDVDERRWPTGVGRDRRQPRCHRFQVDETERLINGRRGEHIAASEDLREFVMVTPADEEHVLGADAADRVVRVLTFPLAGEATSDHEHRSVTRGRPHRMMGLDQQLQPLEPHEATSEHDHRYRLPGLIGECRQSSES